MNKINTTLKRITNPTVSGILILLVSVIVIIFTSWILYNRTVNILTQNLRERLLSISVTAAANIDPKDLDALQQESDWQKPEWAKVVTELKKIKDSDSNVVFVYIIRKTRSDPNQMEFVVDAGSINPYANTDSNPANDVDANNDGTIEPDGADKLQWPGQPDPDPADHIPEAFEAYNRPLTVKNLYEDVYGRVLTSYAPIKDSNGNTVAVLATDIKAENFFTATRQTLQPFLIFIGFLSSIISILILVVIFSWKKYDKYLQEIYKKEVKQRMEIEHLLEIKSEFIGVVSHQLRTPVSVIKGMSSMLKEGDLDNAPKEQKDRFIAGIFEKSEKLAEILDDILEAEELDMDNFAFIPSSTKPVNLSQIIKGIFDDLSSLAEKKKLNYEINIDPGVANLNLMTNGSFLRHVFQNIIDNAIKYSRENGTVAVDLSKDNEYFICKITDSGIGVPEDQKGRLFEKFFRARNAVDTYAYGTGLGLFIARKIIEAHSDGKIWFESEINKGTVFYIKLPIAK